MKSIQVSLDVFQAIWTARKNEEQSEDTILRRLLRLRPLSAKSETQRDLHVQIGFHDPRYGVEIRPGFEIFRTYKGREFRAQAHQGFWFLNGQGYPSLNELNKSIGGGAENAWKAWSFDDEKGRRQPLSVLRDQSKIIRRSA